MVGRAAGRQEILRGLRPARWVVHRRHQLHRRHHHRFTPDPPSQPTRHLVLVQHIPAAAAALAAAAATQISGSAGEYTVRSSACAAYGPIQRLCSPSAVPCCAIATHLGRRCIPACCSGDGSELTEATWGGGRRVGERDTRRRHGPVPSLRHHGPLRAPHGLYQPPAACRRLRARIQRKLLSGPGPGPVISSCRASGVRVVPWIELLVLFGAACPCSAAAPAHQVRVYSSMG